MCRELWQADARALASTWQAGGKLIFFVAGRSYGVALDYRFPDFRWQGIGFSNPYIILKRLRKRRVDRIGNVAS